MAEQDFVEGIKRELEDAESIGNKIRADGAREALRALGALEKAAGRQKAVKASPENTSKDE